MKLNLFTRVIFACLLAFTVSSLVYFAFGNIYSAEILRESEFQQQFNAGVYQYRILGPSLLIWLHDLLSTLNIDYQLFRFKLFSTEAEPQMMLSFYLLNTFFLVLAAVMMVLILENRHIIATSAEKTLLLATMIFTAGFSQFVLVPYDMSGLFFMLFFIFYLLRFSEKNSPFRLLILLGIIAVSTLNRESSAICISLAATMLYQIHGLKKQTIWPVAWLAIAFVAVYAGVRLLNQSFTTNDGDLLTQNFTEAKNLLGLLFWLVFFLFSIFLAKDRNTAGQICLFHLLCAPYIIMCFYGGIIYEIRLYVPLFVASLVLARLEFSRVSIN